MHLRWLLMFLFILESGAVPILISVTRRIKLFEDWDTTNETFLASSAHRLIAVDYHLARGEMYFTEMTGRIYRSRLKSAEGLETPTVIAEVKVSEGVAVDWLHDNLYWTDVGRHTLEVATLDGLYRKVLFNATHGLEKPRAIVLDPSRGLLFWSDWGKNTRVESSGLDGQNKKTVVSSDIHWPNGLAIDLSYSKLFILDGYLSTISSCNYDGSDLYVLRRSEDNFLEAFGLTFYANTLYWNSWRSRSLFGMNTITLRAGIILQQTVLLGISERMMGLKAVHTSLQPKPSVSDPCQTATCSHRCLVSRDLTPTCFCPFGYKLSNDNKNCIEEGYLIVSWGETIRRYTVDGNEDESLIFVTKAAISISYHQQKGLVFWSDIEEHRIYSAPLDQLNNKTVVATPETCDGLAVDWIHDVLYWTDTDRNTLEAAELDGSKHMIIFDKDLDQPRDVAIDPFSGFIFWTAWGAIPKIERSNLHGFERKLIMDDNHAWPNGITIDIQLKKIYYVDGQLGTIYSSLYDGSDRKIIYEPEANLKLFSITLLNNEIFWTDWYSRALYRSPKDEVEVAKGIDTSSNISLRPNGVKAVHSSLQKAKDNPCAAARCQNLCLGTKSHTAHCMGEETPDIDVRIDPNTLPTSLDRIETAIVYKKSNSDVFFRIKVTNGTEKQLERFVGSYSSEKANTTGQFESAAEPCVMWPESYCLHVSALQRNTVYVFKISLAMKGGEVGNIFTVTAITKEEASGPPEDVRVIKYNATYILLEWHHPNESNGIIKDFIINIEETETFEEDKFSKSFPIVEMFVSAEEPFYEYESNVLTPASSYAISISAKNMYIGTSATIVANTAPPPMEIIRMPRVEVTSLMPLSWKTGEKPTELPQYHVLIRSYMLLLLPSMNEPLNDAGKNYSDALKELLHSTFGDRLVVLWDKKVEDTAAFKNPIKVENLPFRKKYKLAWVQVSRYKDSFNIDLLESDPFIAL